MSGLAEFLLARLAEDEAVARAAIENPVRADADAVYVRWSRHDTGWVPAASGEWTEGSALFARWDPARVLAECEAKRRIVEHHRRHPDPLGDPLGDLCEICSEVGPDAQGWPCLTLRALALPYADHPDYRQEWAA